MGCTRSASVLLDPRSTGEELLAAAEELYTFFSSVARSGDADRQDCLSSTASTALCNGLALGPGDAANCLRDAPRTAAFLRGLRDAIAVAQRRFPGERLEIVYAGTGPFAALAVPLMPRVAAGVRSPRFTFIDIHEESLASVARILRHLGLGATLVCADATRYVHPVPIHIVLTETMQRALSVEPQVAIVANLARQLHCRGILIPQRISVDLVVDDVRVGRVADLTRRTALRGLPRRHLLVPPHRSARYVTRITTFGGHAIVEGESGLTSPQLVHGLTPGETAFWYETGARPGIQNSRSCR